MDYLALSGTVILILLGVVGFLLKPYFKKDYFSSSVEFKTITKRLDRHRKALDELDQQLVKLMVEVAGGKVDREHINSTLKDLRNELSKLSNSIMEQFKRSEDKNEMGHREIARLIKSNGKSNGK